MAGLPEHSVFGFSDTATWLACRGIPCRCRGPGHFLLLAQEKVTKEKGTLAAAVTRASCPRDYASRLRGSLTVRPCTDSELAGILPAIAVRLFLRLLAAAERGPGRAQARQSLPQKHRALSPLPLAGEG